MKIFKKIISLALVLVMFALMLVSCNDDNNTGNDGNTPAGDNNGAKTKVTLTIWCSAADQAMTKAMCAAYAAANPQNEYKFLFGIQEENNTAEKVLNDVKNGPDIYSFPSDQINRLYAGGALARIGGSIEANIKDVNTPESVDAATINVNGQDYLIAYPVTGDNCYFVFYDKRVHSEADLGSLDTMLATAALANKQVHFKLNNDGWYLSSFFFTNPELKYDVTYSEVMAETGVEINYDTPAGLTVMQAIQNYVQNPAFYVTTDDAILTNAFVDGTASAGITGTWNAKAIEEALGAENVGFCKLPTAKIGGQDTQLSGYKGYKLMGVNAMSQNKAEAHKLAQWLTNAENQVTRYETRRFNPTNKAALENEKVKADLMMQVVAEQFTYNRTQKGVPTTYWSPMAGLIQPIVNAAASEDKTPVPDSELQQALKDLCEAIRK